MNMIVVFEDQATKQCLKSKPYEFASALEVHCLCGNLVHAIPGTWCTKCGTKVVEVRPERCAERANLGAAVAQAVSNMYFREREYRAAKERKESTTELTLALQAARDAERAATHDYAEHIKKHDCKASSRGPHDTV
jgi:hypothetical protein